MHACMCVCVRRHKLNFKHNAERSLVIRRRTHTHTLVHKQIGVYVCRLCLYAHMSRLGYFILKGDKLNANCVLSITLR